MNRKNNKTQYRIFTNSSPRYGNTRKPRGITLVPSNKICYNQPSGFSATEPSIGGPISPANLPNPGDALPKPDGALECLAVTNSMELNAQLVYVVNSLDSDRNLITSYTSVQIYNSSDSNIWINWSADQNATKTINGLDFNTQWTKVLNNLNITNFLDDITLKGYFELAKKTSVLLPYFGISVRIAPALGCVKNGDTVTCPISGSGTPSPQTLIEYNWTPTGADVIDLSYVDGFSLPARLDYVTNDTIPKVTSVYANCSKNICPPQYQIIKDSKYAGCASPCSYENNFPDEQKDYQQIEEVCCKAQCDTPPFCTVGCTNTDTNNTIVSPYVVNWCNLVKSMTLSTPTPKNGQPAYCYAYDDKKGSIVDQEKINTRIKITFCLGDIGK
jgi:hypothetical protein